MGADCHIYVAAATTIPVEEIGPTPMSRELIAYLKLLCAIPVVSTTPLKTPGRSTGSLRVLQATHAYIRYCAIYNCTVCLGRGHISDLDHAGHMLA